MPGMLKSRTLGSSFAEIRLKDASDKKPGDVVNVGSAEVGGTPVAIGADGVSVKRAPGS